MKMIPQQLAIVALMVFLFSCNEKKEEPVTKSNPEQAVITNVNLEDSISNAYASIDKSPMDMSYYPVDYPKLKMADNNIAPPIARVIYSRPHLSGRKLFHEVLKYGEHWRLGANEATEIDFFRDVTIQNSKIKQGRYILYCILGPDKWSMAINSNIDSWGLEQDSTRDIKRFDIPATHGNPPLEYFTMVFEKTNTGANLIMGWDEVIAKLPISF